MLPQGLRVIDASEESEIPTKTYKFDFEHKRISGSCDGMDAMVQAVHKIFKTERYAWEIYTHKYGIEFENLVGAPIDYVTTILESRIRDALLADDRIIDLQNFEVNQTNSTGLTVSCIIITTQGNFEFREELST